MAPSFSLSHTDIWEREREGWRDEGVGLGLYRELYLDLYNRMGVAVELSYSRSNGERQGRGWRRFTWGKSSPYSILAPSPYLPAPTSSRWTPLQPICGWLPDHNTGAPARKTFRRCHARAVQQECTPRRSLHVRHHLGARWHSPPGNSRHFRDHVIGRLKVGSHFILLSLPTLQLGLDDVILENALQGSWQ